VFPVIFADCRPFEPFTGTRNDPQPTPSKTNDPFFMCRVVAQRSGPGFL
jgi:hypothetical protein